MIPGEDEAKSVETERMCSISHEAPGFSVLIL